MKTKRKKKSRTRHAGLLKRLCRKLSVPRTFLKYPEAVARFNQAKRRRVILRRVTDDMVYPPVKRIIPVRVLFKHPAQ